MYLKPLIKIFSIGKSTPAGDFHIVQAKSILSSHSQHDMVGLGYYQRRDTFEQNDAFYSI